MEKGGISLLHTPSIQEDQRDSVSFLQDWAVHAAAKPRDLDRERAQRCCCCCLRVAIFRQENTTTSEPSSLPSLSQMSQWAPEEAVAVSVGLQSTLSANMRTGGIEAFSSPNGSHVLRLILKTGEDTEARSLSSASCHYWDNKATKAPVGLYQPSPRPPIAAALLAVSGQQGTVLGFYGL